MASADEAPSGTNQTGGNAPSMDYDNLDDAGVIDLFKRVKEAWQPRDVEIERAVELRQQSWNVVVPKAWRTTAKQHHTSRSKEIPTRIVGTLMLNDPQFSRNNPGEDFGMGEDANQVERWHAANFAHWDANGMKGRSAYEFTLDNIVGRGGVAMASLLTPQVWAGAPLLFGDDDTIRREFWRGSDGKPVDDYGQVDPDAAARAHQRSVDRYRQTVVSNRPGGMPVSRRVLPPNQTYPLIQEGELLGMFVERWVSMLDLGVRGWQLDLEAGAGYSTGSGYGSSLGAAHSMVEFWTPNRCRNYFDENPIAYKGGDKSGIKHGYGFVPWVYQTALNAGETEYGAWGLPILGLIDSNIRTYDTLKTYLMNAVHLASFVSFAIEYVGEDRTVGSLIETKSGKKLTTFDFQSGTIMDFGPNRKVVPLTHPGLNADFWKALQAEEAEMDRIIPRTLTGEATSSGYNTALSSTQARALFNSEFRATELLLQQIGVMDMRHVEQLPGPVYVDWEKPSSGRSKKFERVMISKALVNNYYHLQVDINRVVDPITEGTFRANMIEKGVGDIEWAAEGAGIHDYEDMLARQARDRVFQSDTTRAALEARAVQRFKLQQAVADAQAASQIQTAPDGTPQVTLPDGRTAAPGLGIGGIQGGQGVQVQTTSGRVSGGEGIQVPSAQGGAGPSGGLNNNLAIQSNGGPNMNTTHNPGSRRRGGKPGRTPGAPQAQPFRPTPQNPAVQ